MIEPISTRDPDEYILVSDRDSKILLAHSSLTTENPLEECQKLARLIRAANGEVTIFKATKY